MHEENKSGRTPALVRFPFLSSRFHSFSSIATRKRARRHVAAIRHDADSDSDPFPIGEPPAFPPCIVDSSRPVSHRPAHVLFPYPHSIPTHFMLFHFISPRFHYTPSHFVPSRLVSFRFHHVCLFSSRFVSFSLPFVPFSSPVSFLSVFVPFSHVFISLCLVPFRFHRVPFVSWSLRFVEHQKGNTVSRREEKRRTKKKSRVGPSHPGPISGYRCERCTTKTSRVGFPHRFRFRFHYHSVAPIILIVCSSF